mgnify:CR=1 FL=1
MNLDEPPAQLAARTALASAMQRLGHSLVARQVDTDLAVELAEVAERYTSTVQRGAPRDRATEMLSSPRVTAALNGKRAIIDDGAEIDLFRDSFVSGRTNPMGIGVRVVRDGDTAVATTAPPAAAAARARFAILMNPQDAGAIV